MILGIGMHGRFSASCSGFIEDLVAQLADPSNGDREDLEELLKPALVHGLGIHKLLPFFGAICSLAKQSFLSDWSRCLTEVCS